jgi:hypothetical protein
MKTDFMQRKVWRLAMVALSTIALLIEPSRASAQEGTVRNIVGGAAPTSHYLQDEKCWGCSYWYTPPDALRYIAGDSNTATITGCWRECPSTVVIPDKIDHMSVIAIADHAFWPYITVNDPISAVRLPSALERIGDDAFRGNSISALIIPESVQVIGDRAFGENQLTAVKIPDSVTSLGEDAFSGNRIGMVEIGAGTHTIGLGAFSGNEITALVIPATVREIRSYAFDFNRISSLVLAEGVRVIGERAFEGNSLSTLMIPKSVRAIGKEAFAYNQLKRVIFFGNAPSSGSGVFRSNTGLKSVTRYSGSKGWGIKWGGFKVVTSTTKLRAYAWMKPEVLGQNRVNYTVTAGGIWTGWPTPKLTYQWFACLDQIVEPTQVLPSDCRAISGATKNVLTVTSDLRRLRITVMVTATSLGTAPTRWVAKTRGIR